MSESEWGEPLIDHAGMSDLSSTQHLLCCCDLLGTCSEDLSLRVQAKYVTVKEGDVEKIKALLNTTRLWNSDLQGTCSV